MAETFGRVLARHRRARGLSQGDLAARAGCSRIFVYYLESGRSLPKLPLAVCLARALRVRLETLARPFVGRCRKGARRG